MSSPHSLVEANAFNRRRLATALLSGSAARHELAWGRPLHGWIGGVVVAGLVLAGAGISRVWTDPLGCATDEARVTVAEGAAR